MSTIIDKNWLETNKNPYADTSLAGLVTRYVSGIGGAYRLDKLFQHSATIAGHKGLSGKFGTGANALSVPRLPSVNAEAVQSLSSLRKDPEISFFRKAVKALRDTMDAIAANIYAFVFITGRVSPLPIAQVSDLAVDLADAHISASDYSQAATLEAKATGEAKVALEHTRKHNLVRTMKAVASIAITILSFTLAVTGVVLPIVAFTIGLLALTALAIVRDLHKDWGRYKVINFDREVLLEV